MMSLCSSDPVLCEKEFFCSLMDQIDLLVYHSNKGSTDIPHRSSKSQLIVKVRFKTIKGALVFLYSQGNIHFSQIEWSGRCNDDMEQFPGLLLITLLKFCEDRFVCVVNRRRKRFDDCVQISAFQANYLTNNIENECQPEVCSVGHS